MHIHIFPIIVLPTKKRACRIGKRVCLLVSWKGIEPPTYRLGGDRSILLSYQDVMFYCFQNPFTITQIEKAFNHKFSVIPGGILHSTNTSVLNQSLVRQILKLSRFSNGSSVLVTNCRTVSPSCTSKVSFSFKNFSTLAFASATPKTISDFLFSLSYST